MAESRRTKADTDKKSTSTGSKKNISGNSSKSAKKVTTVHANRNAGTTGSRAKAKKRTITTAQKQNRIDRMNQYQDYQAFEMGITIFVVAIVSLFLYLTFFQMAGKAGDVIGGLFFGFFGWFAWFLPITLIVGIVFYHVNRGDRRVPRRLFSFGGVILSLLGLTDLVLEKQIITEYYVSNHVFHQDYFECMYMTCQDVISRGKFNGGLLGRWIGVLFSGILGDIAATIILIAVFLFSLYLFYGVEMMAMIRKKNAYHQEMEEIYSQVKEEETYQEPSYRVFHTTKEKPVRRVAPNLEKVPKVQSFDLHQLNKRMDRMEEVMEETLGKSVTSIVKEQKTEKKEEKVFVPKTEPKEKLLSPGMEEIKKDGEDFFETKELLPKESGYAVKSDEIPIYRNELAEKFGKKKSATKAVKIQQIISEKEEAKEQGSVLYNNSMNRKEPDGEELHNNVLRSNELQDVKSKEADNTCDENVIESNAADIEKTIEDEVVLQEENAYTTEVEKAKTELSQEDVEEKDDVTVQEETVTKPMNSFAYKEEVTDVTPSYLKETMNKQPVSSSHPKETISKQATAVTKTVSSHGKIGGENYVSKSDTFNALNESKVRKEPERPYQFPPLELLQEPKENENAASDSELRQTAMKLQETLRSFNVNVQMGPVTCGPTVTRYELFPEQGVRVNKITNLSDDLKLSLAAQSIRIEAPIPGKAAVGIEVPNPVPGMVCFRELLEGNTFQESKSDLTFAVGKDIAGKLIMADIGKMPHLLIAGATGSGKSVCINTLLMSILYKADPKDVKLIMIDPKVVELSVYNGIPHLFCPVVTDPKEAAAALNWAVREMTDRYEKFKEIGVRNIAGYNQKIKTVENAEQAGYTKMPYLVVIVDEFADLMMVASKEVEDAVCRLAQLARAAGIHLVLATQRPSVNVITGVIKANIPSRIAFSVSSAIDSRTILDKGGAEKLLGKGDMLFFPSGYTEPVRVQGAFISDEEVSAVVDFLRENNSCPEYNTDVTQIVEEQEEEAKEEKKPSSDRDEYFEDAGRFVIESDRAAAGQLQRRFSIGFNRAGRIIDQLHKAGVVGPAEGTKPRKVLMDVAQFEQMLSGDSSVVSEEEMEAMSRELDEMTATMEE